MIGRKNALLASLLCLALTVGCAARTAQPEKTAADDPAPTAETSAEPVKSPESDPESPAATDQPTEKNAVTELLEGVFDDYHAGTAGCSLKAAWYAASLLRSGRELGTNALLAGASAFDRGYETPFGEKLSDKMDAVYLASLGLTDGILDDCGYDGPRDFSADEKVRTFSVLYDGLGLTMPDLSEVSGALSVSVTVDRQTAVDYDRETGKELLTFACDTPAVSIPGNEEAEDRINEALRADSDLFTGGTGKDGLSGREDFLNEARNELAYRRGQSDDLEYFMPYQLTRTVFVGRADGRVVSLISGETSYAGGAHGWHGTFGSSYDTRTGELLTLETLSSDPGFIPALREKLLEVSRDADHAEYTEAYYVEDAELLDVITAPGHWFFTAEGLTFIANPYDVAPYAYGGISFVVPYSWLEPWLDAELLPETVMPDGDLFGEIVPAAAETEYSVDDGTEGAGACVVFTAEGRVSNVTVTRIETDFSYMTYIESGTLAYIPLMEDGQALCIRTWIPDVLPNLLLTYEGAEGVRSFLISQSGRDGSLELLDPASLMP